MGMDKYALQYHGMAQYQYAGRLLQPYCSKLILSCNACDLLLTSGEIDILQDRPEYRDIGPMAGILSAFHAYPNKNWLVLACDYPLITDEEVRVLADCKQGADLAAAFYNQSTGFFEPLLGFYTAACFPLLEDSFRQGQYSLQQFLKAQNAGQCYTSAEHRLESVDTPEAYRQTLLRIRDNDY